MKEYLITELEGRWIPTTEALPISGLALLIATERCGVRVGNYSEKGYFYMSGSSCPLHGVTHWRLIPSNPNKPGKNDATIKLNII